MTPPAADPTAPTWSGLWRYAAVGGVATACHYGVLAVGVEGLAWPAPLAAAAGAVAGAQVAYVGNRVFTFGHHGAVGASWRRFQAVAVLGAAVSAALVAGGEAIGLHYGLSQAVATGIVMGLTYRINRAWSFR